ncbi:MAG: CPBP family intramembrane metalloprotease [Acholeplasmataceae bacterium]|nr:CPBP family intramembrane metalloprotease [Acholeplasmataceae bacterium]
MDEEKEIIQFEDLFKDELKPKKPDKYKPDRKGIYLSAIFIYFIVMFVIVGVLYAAIQNVPELQVTYTESELILEQIAYDVDGIAIMSEAIYQEYHEPYDGYVRSIDTYIGYAVLVNTANPYYEELMLNVDQVTGVITLKTEVFLEIIQDMTILTWDGGERLINIYAGKNQTLPYFFGADYYEIEGPVTEFSDLGYSILNFSVYLILLPTIFFMLKIDFVGDFNEFKVRGIRWIPMIAIGYVYIIIGNVFSNYASNFLSNIFGIAQSEAVNQITIMRSLNSSGAIFMILSAVVMGPIVEELIFRKSIFGLFKNDKFALVVSSIIFGSIHLIGEASILEALVNGLSYFTMGFVFGFIYLQNNKNIIAPISVHILSNLISIVALLYFF